MVHDLTVFKKENGRNITDAVFLEHSLILLEIDLAEFDSPLITGKRFFYYWSIYTTGSAPISAEFHQKGSGTLKNLFPEVGIGQSDVYRVCVFHSVVFRSDQAYLNNYAGKQKAIWKISKWLIILKICEVGMLWQVVVKMRGICDIS